MPRRGKRRAPVSQPPKADNMSVVGSAVLTAVRFAPDVAYAVKAMYDTFKSKGSGNENDSDQGPENTSKQEEERKQYEAERQEMERERRARREENERVSKETQESIEKMKAEAKESLQKELRELRESAMEALTEELRKSVLEEKVSMEEAPPLAEAQPQVTQEKDGQQKSPEKPKPQPPAHLPAVCQQYWSRKGCAKSTCNQLHLCKRFLADICKFGDKCRNGHSLDSTHNKTVCAKEGVPADLETLHRLVFRIAEQGRFSDQFYHMHLELCFKAGTADTCRNCSRVHICGQYVAGTCERGTNCKFGHDLHTVHNSAVLDQHRASELRDDDILQLLYDNSATKIGRWERK